MTADDYKQWIEYHRGLFAMKSAEDAPMFAAWFPSLAEFTIVESKAASLAIASDMATAARFRTEHLALLRSKIKDKRFERTRAEFEELNRSHDSLQCQICGGDGTVSVPHTKSIVDGIWTHPFYSMLVACTCNRGANTFNAIANAMREKSDRTHKPPMTMIDLREYEAMHHNWPDLVKARREQRKSEQNAEWHARKADQENPIRREKVAEVVEAIGLEDVPF